MDSVSGGALWQPQRGALRGGKRRPKFPGNGQDAEMGQDNVRRGSWVAKDERGQNGFAGHSY